MPISADSISAAKAEWSSHVAGKEGDVGAVFFEKMFARSADTKKAFKKFDAGVDADKLKAHGKIVFDFIGNLLSGNAEAELDKYVASHKQKQGDGVTLQLIQESENDLVAALEQAGCNKDAMAKFASEFYSTMKQKWG